MVDDSLKGSRGHRDRLFIMAEMLDIARKEALKTHLMYKANLSYAQLNEYLSLLLNLNLLERNKTSDKVIYKTTEKGLRYVQSYKEIRELLKGKENCMKEANSLHLVKRGKRILLL